MSNRELGKKVEELESRLNVHDEQILSILSAIKKLIEPPPVKKPKRIGFDIEDKIR